MPWQKNVSIPATLDPSSNPIAWWRWIFPRIWHLATWECRQRHVSNSVYGQCHLPSTSAIRLANCNGTHSYIHRHASQIRLLKQKSPIKIWRMFQAKKKSISHHFDRRPNKCAPANTFQSQCCPGDFCSTQFSIDRIRCRIFRQIFLKSNFWKFQMASRAN